MSLSINNNITALNAWRNLKRTDVNMGKSMEKLSSGLRINRAADDPAGLVISEKMRAQLSGIDAAVKNSEKAVNMIQTAEAALNNVNSLLIKIRQLVLDSANSGVNDSAMLAANQAELDEAVSSITRIADFTQFGTKKLLDGSLSSTITGTTGLAAGATFDLTTNLTAGNDEAAVKMSVTQKATQGTAVFRIASGSAAGSITIDGQIINIASTDSAADVQNTIAANSILTARYTVTTSATAGEITVANTSWGTDQTLASIVSGSGSAAITNAVNTAGVNVTGTIQVGTDSTVTLSTGTGLTLRDANGNSIKVTSTAMAAAALNTVNNVGSLDDNSALFHVGPNEDQVVRVGIKSAKAAALGMGATYGETDASVTAFASLADLTSTSTAVSGGVLKNGSADQLSQAIGVLDKAIDDITTLRGALGAVQSDNLEVQLDSLRVAYENLQASESTIRDADMTREMAEFTKHQIMLQAGTSMLAQANQIPQTLLQLLQ